MSYLDIIIIIFVTIFIYSCNKDKPKNTNNPERLKQFDETQKSKNEDHQKPMLPMKKVQILIGGCMEQCSEPLKAFHNYLNALKDDATGREAIKFVDTVRLVYNGEELGKKWAKMWNDMLSITRKESIDDFAVQMREWVSKISRSYELNNAIINGVQLKENWSTRAVIHFTPPAIEGMDFVKDWVYILKPRGLEWLIVEINQ